ncbi:MAG: arylamine N-acetyltransferase [Emcibacter sp.]|nr:arylamine N-acetyltransferase [Emcibacter sp.]
MRTQKTIRKLLLSKKNDVKMIIMDNNYVDLDGYFERIGYYGSRNATLETLKSIQQLHIDAIPFEAIDVLLGRGIDITAEAIYNKLIVARRGGYCFEHGGLLKRVLSSIGFDVSGLIARVKWMSEPNSAPPPRSHMVLCVQIEDKSWLVDVGFGGCVPTAPLSFGTSEPQETNHETYRLTPARQGHLLEVMLDGVWKPVYEVSREEQLEVDFVTPNWFTSTHPQSIFCKNLMVARTTPEARFTLLANRLTIRRQGQKLEQHLLSVDQIERALSDIFNLTVDPEWKILIEKAAQT